jgi:hypothetical protein
VLRLREGISEMSDTSANFETAARMAGQLYGNILFRDADSGGYDYYLNALQQGSAPVKEHVREFFTSQEFIHKFVINETPNQLIRNLICTFFSQKVAAPDWVEEPLTILIDKGYKEAIRYFISDKRYDDRHGLQSIPRYVPNHTLMF